MKHNVTSTLTATLQEVKIHATMFAWNDVSFYYRVYFSNKSITSEKELEWSEYT